MSYMTISSQENHHYSLCSYFHTHPTTLLLKILGGPMHGPSPPPQILGGPSPPVPPRSPPLGLLVTKVYFQLHASLRFVSLFNVEAALVPQMSPAPAVRPTGIFPGVSAGQSTTVVGRGVYSLVRTHASTHTFTPTSLVRNFGVIFDQNLINFSPITSLSFLSLA